MERFVKDRLRLRCGRNEEVTNFRMSYSDFTEMPVWKSAFQLLLKSYKITKAFPSDERYGLIADMRRAANSVVHNIAEGFGRFESRDKTRFYKISRGSSFEIISQILVASHLEYIRDDSVTNELDNSYRDIISELNSLIKTHEQPDR